MIPISFNYYTTRRDLEKEYFRALQTRRLPAKYRFIGKEHAKAWIDICYNSEYSYYTKPYDFLNSIKEEIGEIIKGDINLIALGSCNGMKDKILAEEFLKSKKISFCIIDLAKELAMHTIKDMKEFDIPKEVFISNLIPQNMRLISEVIRENYYSTHLFTILGNSFGNLPQELISKSLRDAMNSNDYLLLGVHITPDKQDPMYVQEVIDNYNNKEYNHQVMLSLSRAGITNEDGFIEVEYSNDKYFPDINVVSHFFKFSKSKVVRYFNEDIYFAKGERILVTYSNKYRLDILRRIIKDHGFEIQKEFVNTQDNYAKILCKLA